jgi:hypothetical protein
MKIKNAVHALIGKPVRIINVGAEAKIQFNGRINFAVNGILEYLDDENLDLGWMARGMADGEEVWIEFTPAHLRGYLRMMDGTHRITIEGAT